MIKIYLNHHLKKKVSGSYQQKMDQWNNGTMVQWNNGSMDQWINRGILKLIH